MQRKRPLAPFNTALKGSQCAFQFSPLPSSLPLPSTHPPIPTFELPPPPHLPPPPPRTVTHLLCLPTPPPPPPPPPYYLVLVGVGGGGAGGWMGWQKIVQTGRLLTRISPAGVFGAANCRTCQWNWAQRDAFAPGKDPKLLPDGRAIEKLSGNKRFEGLEGRGGAGGRGEGGGVDVVDAVSDVYLVYLRWVYTSNQGIRVQAWAVLLPWPAQNLFLSCRLIPWEECVCVRGVASLSRAHS